MGKGPGDQAAVYPAYVVVSPQDLGLQPGKVIDSYSVLLTTEQAASDYIFKKRLPYKFFLQKRYCIVASHPTEKDISPWRTYKNNVSFP
jgi:hypothetical protein